MNTLFWLLVALSMAMQVAPVTMMRQRFYEDDYLSGFARRAGLPLPAPLRAPLLRRVRARERWALLGGAIGFVLGAVTGLICGWTDGIGPLGLLASMAGASAGGVLAIIAGRDDFRSAAPRVARAQATALKDYLTGKVVWLARLAPLGAAGVLAVGFVILDVIPGERPADTERWMAVASVALALTAVLLLLAETVSRIVLSRAQRAGSELELAWDDICRSEALRSLYGIPTLMAAASALMSLVMVGVVVIDPAVRALSPQGTLLAGGTMIVAAGAVINLILGLMILFRIEKKSSGYVLRRLWSGARFAAEGA